MTNDEQTAGKRQALTFAKGCLLSILLVLFVASLPLTCVYSLKAQLRYLAQIQDNGPAVDVGEIYEVEAVPHSVAFSMEPEAVLQRGLSDPPRSNTTLYTPPRVIVVSPSLWRVVHRFIPTNDHTLARPFTRVYDPLGPPSLFV